MLRATSNAAMRTAVVASERSSTASELLAMAVMARDRPYSALHRSALVHAAAEVIRLHGDAEVLTAIELAPDRKVARLLWEAAGSACETVATSSQGVERQARIFAIGVVMRFASSLTTRECSDQLNSLLATGSLLACRDDRGPEYRLRSFIWPGVWTFSAMRLFSFGDVRRHAILASSADVASSDTGSLPQMSTVQIRSTTFMRYALGCHVSEGNTPPPGPGWRFAHDVKGRLLAGLPELRDITVTYDGHFYGALWRTLSVHQRYRLTDVVKMLATHVDCAADLGASIALARGEQDTMVRITFSRTGKKLEQHTYDTPLEPYADPIAAMRRISTLLRQLGVKTEIAAPPSAMGTGGFAPTTKNGQPHAAPAFELAWRL